MNETKKKTPARFNFNLLDVIIILLALFCIVGVWQRKNLQNLFRSGNAYDAYTVTFAAQGVRRDTAALLTEDAAVWTFDEKGTKIDFGSLTDIEYPADVTPVDLTGALSCRIVEKNGRYLLDGKYQLAVNQTVTVHTETVDLVICITGIAKSA